MRMSTRLLLVAGVVLLTSGCAGIDDANDPTGAEHSTLSTEQAVTACTLAWLNDPSTTLEVLDLEVGLEARAARGLIARRDGSDGRAGTVDDDLFAHSAEIESVAYVGEATLSRLTTASLAWCEARPDQTFEGHWHGVALTQRQAEMILTVVNVTPAPELEALMDGNRRASAAIFEHREIGSLDALAALDGIGRAEMIALRAEAMSR